MPTVLVVEDNKLARKVLAEQLKACGYTVLEADCGTTAQAMITRGAPDAILLDWELPDIDGPSLLLRWGKHEEHRWIPVLMVTGHKKPEYIQRALDLGALDYVRKPTEKIELHARLSSALRIRDLQRDLRRLAERDPLTGLINRRALDNKLDRAIDRCSFEGTELAVALLDLDHFKRINDTHGHDVGDMVLKQFAKHLRTAPRSCTTARYGGQEFVVVVEGIKSLPAVEMLNQLLVQMADKQWGRSDNPLEVTFSAGVVIVGGRRPSPAQVLKWADEALYRAKDAGRNQIKITTMTRERKRAA